MVVRGWGGAVATAAGAAAAAGAAQLGLGYGMEVISWPVGSEQPAEAWVTSLTWAAWIAASSTIIGAIVAERLRTTPVAAEASIRVLWRLVLALAAAAGAGATAVLVAVPARVAEVAGTPSPQAEAGGYALLGVLVGLIVAACALAARAVAANLLVTAAWLWLLAAAAVVESVLSARDWTRVPLAYWELAAAGPWFRNILVADAALALGAAVLIGALAALPAARRGDHPTGVVVSGAAGPLVVAAAYLLAQPELGGAAAVDLSRQLTAPYLVIAGLLGSLLVAAVPQRRTEQSLVTAAEPQAEDPAGDGPAGAAAAGTGTPLATGSGGDDPTTTGQVSPAPRSGSAAEPADPAVERV